MGTPDIRTGYVGLDKRNPGNNRANVFVYGALLGLGLRPATDMMRALGATEIYGGLGGGSTYDRYGSFQAGAAGAFARLLGNQLVGEIAGRPRDTIQSLVPTYDPQTPGKSIRAVSSYSEFAPHERFNLYNPDHAARIVGGIFSGEIQGVFPNKVHSMLTPEQMNLALYHGYRTWAQYGAQSKNPIVRAAAEKARKAADGMLEPRRGPDGTVIPSLIDRERYGPGGTHADATGIPRLDPAEMAATDAAMLQRWGFGEGIVPPVIAAAGSIPAPQVRSSQDYLSFLGFKPNDPAGVLAASTAEEMDRYLNDRRLGDLDDATRLEQARQQFAQTHQHLRREALAHLITTYESGGRLTPEQLRLMQTGLSEERGASGAALYGRQIDGRDGEGTRRAVTEFREVMRAAGVELPISRPVDPDSRPTPGDDIERLPKPEQQERFIAPGTRA